MSAVVLAPVVLALIYFGAPYTQGLIILVAALASWEWDRLCTAGKSDTGGAVAIAGAVVTAGLAAAGLYEVAIWLMLAVMMGQALLVSRSGGGSGLWRTFGVAYVSLPLIAFLWLRFEPAEGRTLIFWLLFVVWATDTGAYIAGRLIGGPKLAPGLSPKKTWAGLIGGMTAAGIIGASGAYLFAQPAPLPLAFAAVGIALVAQAGDLLESAAKRHFDAKDSSNLIPGHGGILDRIDGLIPSVLLVAASVSWQGIGS